MGAALPFIHVYVGTLTPILFCLTIVEDCWARVGHELSQPPAWFGL
jgi:hypothetical protein